MRKQAIVVGLVGLAALCMVARQASAYCDEPDPETGCQVCCESPGVDNAGGVIFCGQVEGVIGGCAGLAGEVPGFPFFAGCVGSDPADPLGLTGGVDCPEAAVTACSFCGCAEIVCPE